MIDVLGFDCEIEEVSRLLRRSGHGRDLLRCRLEEEIIQLVPIPSDQLEQHRDAWLQGKDLTELLKQYGWDEHDLLFHLSRPLALRAYAEQHFGPGLEETFLNTGQARDSLVYSLIRVRDQALAQELWIRIAEGEVGFAEAAARFGEGPEATHRGVIGPLEIGRLHPPQLAQILRDLAPGQIQPPWSLGEWQMLVRLEAFTPARFDASMRSTLLDEAMQRFMDQRLDCLLKGEELEPLHYDSSS